MSVARQHDLCFFEQQSKQQSSLVASKLVPILFIATSTEGFLLSIVLLLVSVMKRQADNVRSGVVQDLERGTILIRLRALNRSHSTPYSEEGLLDEQRCVSYERSTAGK